MVSKLRTGSRDTRYLHELQSLSSKKEGDSVLNRLTNMKKLLVGMLLVLIVGFTALRVSAKEDLSAAALRASVDYKMEMLTNKRIQLEKSIKALEEEFERKLKMREINLDNPLPFFAKLLRGNVLKVDKKWEFLVIDLGNQNQITVGEKNPQEITVALPAKMTMNVIRGTKFIGTITVTKVNDETAICDISSVLGGREILPGDQVLPADKE